MFEKKRKNYIQPGQIYFIKQDHKDDNIYFVSKGTPVMVIHAHHFPIVRIRDASGNQISISSDYLSDEPVTFIPSEKEIRKRRFIPSFFAAMAGLGAVVSICTLIAYVIHNIRFMYYDYYVNTTPYILVTIVGIVFTIISLIFYDGSKSDRITSQQIEELQALFDLKKQTLNTPEQEQQ